MKKETIKYKTPLTYYGGKQRIAKSILKFLPEHRIYCEPFFGGGAVFFEKRPSFLEVINDHNENLMNFYVQMQTNFTELAARIQSTLHSESLYRKCQLIYQGQVSADPLEKALATWVVFNQSWNSQPNAGWKFDFGTGGSHMGIVAAHSRRNFCPWLEQRLQYVQISCRDALQVIAERDSKETFFYLDPPYPGTNQGHYSGYTFEDLEKLLQILENIHGKFILSNYPSDIVFFYAEKNNWQQRKLVLKKDSNMASVSGSTKTEILLMNYQISVPYQAEIF